MRGDDGIGESNSSKALAEGTRANIIIVIDPQDDAITSFNAQGDCSKEIGIKDSMRIGMRKIMVFAVVSAVLIPDRTKVV